jgi:hypothetical protein
MSQVGLRKSLPWFVSDLVSEDFLDLLMFYAIFDWHSIDSAWYLFFNLYSDLSKTLC